MNAKWRHFLMDVFYVSTNYWCFMQMLIKVSVLWKPLFSLCLLMEWVYYRVFATSPLVSVKCKCKKPRVSRDSSGEPSRHNCSWVWCFQVCINSNSDPSWLITVRSESSALNWHKSQTPPTPQYLNRHNITFGPAGSIVLSPVPAGIHTLSTFPSNYTWDYVNICISCLCLD